MEEAKLQREKRVNELLGDIPEVSGSEDEADHSEVKIE